MSYTDPYLIPGASYQRLVDEYDKYGSLTIGFDFDDTVHDFHRKGRIYPQIVELLRDLKSIRCTLICWTAYESISYVENYCSTFDIPCDGVNTDGIKLPWKSRKPFFSALLDDRAGLAQVYNELAMLVKKVKHND